MEPLQELPVEKWPILQEKLKRIWPGNVAGYYALHLNMKYPNIREAFQFKVYCPGGDMENGFVSINIKAQGSQDCIVFPVSEDTSKLEEALVATKLIDWTRQICFDLVSSMVLRSLDNIRTIMQFRYYDVHIVKTFYLDRTSKAFRVTCPPNTHLGPIKLEDLNHVDDVWPYQFPGSLHYFSVLVRNGLSFGLYSEGKLVSWIFLNEYNFLCHLYCEERWRRKGFAEYLVKCVVNDQLKQGNDIYAYVECGNERPTKMFEKLGFIDVDDGAYAFIKK